MTLAQQYHAEGLGQGLSQGRQQAIIDFLEARFGQIPDGLREAVLEIDDVARLQSLIRAAATVNNLESFTKEL